MLFVKTKPLSLVKLKKGKNWSLLDLRSTKTCKNIQNCSATTTFFYQKVVPIWHWHGNLEVTKISQVFWLLFSWHWKAERLDFYKGNDVQTQKTQFLEKFWLLWENSRFLRFQVLSWFHGKLNLSSAWEPYSTNFLLHVI